MLPWLFLASLAPAASSREGFLNCSGDISEHALRRAYRLMVKESHPDKGGSNEQTAELTSLRDSLLREPLRFQVLRAMFEASLQPFDTSARAQVELQEGWPYLQVEFDFDQRGLLMDGGSWTFAFGLKNGSTVHYRGDERIGGYDVCCDFLRDSRCERHPAGSNANASDSASCQSVGQCGAGLYATSDCPLSERVVARVRRPLHQNITGQWGGALQIRSTSGAEVACLAFAFAHVAPFEETTPQSEAETTETTETVKSPEIQRPDPDSFDGSAFQHVGSGSFCEDGGDLLEGALDHYGGLSPFGGARRATAESSLFYGSRCRERCRRRPLCRFYTAYSSGWCQLSSRCSVLARAGDPLTVTFAKS